MKVLAKQNRELIMINAQNTQNENDAEKIILQVPEQYEDFNKKIVFVTPDGNVWDIITNNEYLIKKAITKYKQVDFYIWLTKGDVDFRSQTKTLKFYHNVDASDEITDEEIGRVNTVVNLLEEEITKVKDIESQIDGKLEEIDTAITNVNTAIKETENLNLDAEKVGQTTTVTLTKKDGTVKTIHIDDGVDLQFMWQGTSLGIKTSEQQEYTFVDLQGVQGQRGEQGEPFTIKKTYTSVTEMNADFNNMQLGDYVMIASTVEVEDNAKLYTRGESAWIFITDFSGATGIRGEVGLTPNIQIGTVTQGSSFNVTRTGTNENPILNFTLVKGDKGDRGIQGIQGLTGNGIQSITKTGTSGLVDTYTITYTNGNTTTFTVTNGEDANITRTEFEELKQENEDLKNNQLTGELSGQSIYLSDSADSRVRSIGLSGNSEQESTTGKNKLPVTLDLLKTMNSGANWQGNVCTRNGITYTVNDDLSITIGGVYSERSFFYLMRPSTNIIFPPERYRITGCPTGGGTDSYRLSMAYYDDSTYVSEVNETGSGNLLDLTSIATPKLQAIIEIKNSSAIGKTFYPMFRLASVTDDTYEPYTGGQASPNPSYPQEIHSTGDSGSVNEKVQNANIFSEKNKTVGQWLSSAGVTSSNPNAIITDYIEILDGRNYVSTSNNTTSLTKYFTINQYDDNKNRITGNEYSVLANAIRVNKTHVFENNCKYIKVSLIDYANMPNFQLEQGTTATDYVAHEEQTISFPLSQGQKLMEGDYLADDGVHHVRGEIVFDGSDDENWTFEKLSALGDLEYRNNFYIKINDALGDNNSSTLNNMGIYANVLRSNYNTYISNGKNLNYLCNDFESVEEFKEFLKTNNMKVQYKLETETIDPYTEEQKTAWEQIKKARTYKPVTHISSTDVVPATVDITYVRDLETVINNLSN